MRRDRPGRAGVSECTLSLTFRAMSCPGDSLLLMTDTQLCLASHSALLDLPSASIAIRLPPVQPADPHSDPTRRNPSSAKSTSAKPPRSTRCSTSSPLREVFGLSSTSRRSRPLARAARSRWRTTASTSGVRSLSWRWVERCLTRSQLESRLVMASRRTSLSSPRAFSPSPSRGVR